MTSHPPALGTAAPSASSGSGGRLQFAVLQMGARMHYAVPALLERAHMLRHFYTDATGNRGLTGALAGIIPEWIWPPPIRRLMGRQIPVEVPEERVTTAQALALRDGLVKRVTNNPDWCHSATDWLRQRMAAEDFRGANALYCLDNGDEGVIREAKRRGMAVVYEQVIAPQVGRIMREERARFPGLEQQDADAAVEAGIRKDAEVWDLADLVLAPSPFVREGMIELGADPDRIGLVPYGLPEHWFGGPTQPVTGRVLFVGSVGLRKGSHYLAEACRILRRRGSSIEFRVVGAYNPQEIASPLFEGPVYVGQVPRNQVRKEFEQADVFAFPTLAEGFALVHLEAMACGVPVVTTPNCGPAVRDGEDGFIVGARDALALANRIETIVGDRVLRNRLAQSARKRAADFSWQNYRDRLMATLGRVHPDYEKRPS